MTFGGSYGPATGSGHFNGQSMASHAGPECLPVESPPDGVHTRSHTPPDRRQSATHADNGQPLAAQALQLEPETLTGRQSRPESRTENRKAKNLFHKFPIQNVIKPFPGSAAHLITGNVPSSRAVAGAGRPCPKKDTTVRGRGRGAGDGYAIYSIIANEEQNPRSSDK